MKTRYLKQAVGFALAALLLVAVPVPAFAADSSYTVGADRNEMIVAALTSAASGDTITLSGNGALTLANTDEIVAKVVFTPSAGSSITVSSGRFMGQVTLNGSDDSSGVTLEDGVYASLGILRGVVNLKDSTVGANNGTVVTMTGGSLVLTENAAVATRDAAAPAVSINGSIGKIEIGAGCYISADRTGIATGNTDDKSIGEISVSGTLQGGYRAAAFGPGTSLSSFSVLSGGSVYANGGAGVGLENASGVISALTVAQDASLTGAVTGVSNMTVGASAGTIINLTVGGTLSGGSAGVSNVDGSIGVVDVSGKILSDRTALGNIRAAGAALIDTVLVQSGGIIWGKGMSGVPGIGIANTGGVIGAVVPLAGGYIEGGSSTAFEGYGIYNGYAASMSGRIDAVTIRGVVAGMDGPILGGIGIYNRAAEIGTLTVEETGYLHGQRVGVANNYDQAPAVIENFVNRGVVMSGTNSLVNSPSGNAAQAVIGSVSFNVENDASGSGSLLRGATDLGQIAGVDIEEIVPVVQSVFSSDYKTLTATCLEAETPSDAIAGLRVQLFCLEDGSKNQIGVTDSSGQVSFTFAEPFSPERNTYWFYTLAHYDEPNHLLYSSSRTYLPAVPSVSGITAASDSLPHSGGDVTLTVAGTDLSAAASLEVRSDTGITGRISPITSDTTNTVTVSLPANTSSGAAKHTFTVWLNGVALPHSTSVSVQGYGGSSSSGSVSPAAPSISINGSTFPTGRIDPLQPMYTLEVAPKDGSAYVTIPYSVLSGWNRQNSSFILEIKTGFASYLVPAKLSDLIPDLPAILKTNGLDTANIAFRVTLTDDLQNPAVSKTLAQRFPGGNALGAIVDFKIELMDNSGSGKVISELNSFNAEIARRIFIPENAPASFGAFRFDADAQSFQFVPHRLLASSGVRYVEIASQTNSVYAVVENVVTFTDVPNSFWATSDIEQAAAKGLVSGVGGSLFEPNRAMSRAEFVRLIMNAVSPEPYQGKGGTYSDVKQSDWFYGAVEKAAELQLLPVITDGHFRPNDAITREEMASILAVVLKSEASALPTVNADLQELFADYKEMDTRLSEDIRIVYQTGVMIGKGGEHFGFKETATRAEAVTVQLRLLKMLGMIDS